MTFKSCLTIGMLLLLQSCGDGNGASTEKDFSKSLDNIKGIYVSEGYQTRDEDDTDWMAVSVIRLNKKEAQVHIRSRVDNGKTATCTYAAAAVMTEDKILTTTFPENSVVFSFKGNALSISGLTETDDAFLKSFCMKGSSIAGTYTKLSEPLDDAQLLKGGFVKKLSMNGVSFKIQAGSSGSSNELMVLPSGLTESNKKIIMPIKGFITEAKIADLNGDNWPELLLFIDLGKSKKTGTVLAWSAKDGKALTKISYPNTFGLDEISEGYMGQDKFSIVDQQLLQEFPMHTPDGKLTGKTRQVKYKLNEKGNAWFFEVVE